MSKPIWNMPGPGGNLGRCAVCGEDFMTEILLGQKVRIYGLEGLEKDFCVHEKCEPIMEKVQESKDWHNFTAGPLRTLFEEHGGATTADQQTKESQ